MIKNDFSHSHPRHTAILEINGEIYWIEKPTQDITNDQLQAIIASSKCRGPFASVAEAEADLEANLVSR
jgi:hypothetical protein